MSTTTTSDATVQSIRQGLELLHAPLGDSCFELRVLGIPSRGKSHNAAGYFVDFGAAAEAAYRYSYERKASGVYTTVNPVSAACLARCANEIEDYLETTTSDSANDVVKRRWLFVDIDPHRSAKVPATDAERELATALAYDIEQELQKRGFPLPVLMDSGNGVYLLYRIDMPNTAESAQLVGDFLKSLNVLAGSVDPLGPFAKVDETSFNASRIMRVPTTWNRKGRGFGDRQHRLAQLLVNPAEIVVPPPLAVDVIRSVAEVVRSTSAHQHDQPGRNGHPRNAGESRLRVDRWLQNAGVGFKVKQLADGRTAYLLSQCPFDVSHGTHGETIVTQAQNGKLGFECKHNSCSGYHWQHAKEKIGLPRPEHWDPPKTPYTRYDDSDTATTEPVEPLEKFTLLELQQKYPTLNPPVIHGLLREGEVGNLIAPSKVGKSWLAYNLAISVAIGRPWLHQFDTVKGRVLLVDNELHRSTLAQRIPKVGDAMGIFAADYHDQFDIWPLRGNLRSLVHLGLEFDKVERGYYKLVVLDAKYRFAVPGVSENDNAAETLIYNLLDDFADRTGAAFIVVHHSSKGDQSDKRTTDVGAGAGAQSRAADCHMILREHEDPDVVVLDAAVRSFQPVESLALRWDFPLWQPAPDVDPGKLKTKVSRMDQRTAERDKEGTNQILAALLDGPATARQLRAKTGLSRERQLRLLDRLQAAGHVIQTTIEVRGNECDQYILAATN
ncbi:MAG: hypothetical protein A2W31_04415 [Planctomycetes bacterium RBG_16_64_10]|nr:MAG: hypothetical protein A2W31_04415 [Planctomycetes bacterium RBG_16_64_10]